MIASGNPRRSMGIDNRKRALHKALVQRILDADAKAPLDLRRRAFDNTDLPEPLSALISKVATAPTTVTEADVARTEAAGYGEDEIFELVICASVGQATRQYEAGLAALAEATTNGERP
jgi:hypothetical protein